MAMTWRLFGAREPTGRVQWWDDPGVIWIADFESAEEAHQAEAAFAQRWPGAQTVVVPWDAERDAPSSRDGSEAS